MVFSPDKRNFEIAEIVTKDYTLSARDLSSEWETNSAAKHMDNPIYEQEEYWPAYPLRHPVQKISWIETIVTPLQREGGKTKMSTQKLSQTQRIKQLDSQTPPTRFTTSGWQLWDFRIKHANYVQSITINRTATKTNPFSRCSKIMHTNCKPKTSNPISQWQTIPHRETHQHQPKEKVPAQILQLHRAQTRRMAVLGKKCTLEVADISVRITRFLSSSVSFAKGTRFCSVWKRKHAEA